MTMQTASPTPTQHDARYWPWFEPPTLASRLIVALDVDGEAAARPLIEALAPLGVTLKVGMQLFYNSGFSVVHAIEALGGHVFLDLKIHDIPNTAAQATAAVVRQGATFLNVHAGGGKAMMQAAMTAAINTAAESGAPKDGNNVYRPLVLGVTVLTSMDDPTWQHTMGTQNTANTGALHLAKLAHQAGLGGVVCSAQEAPAIRATCGPDFVLVTPGIRLPDADTHDQSRIVTPQQALQDGATYLVVGRPITQAANPAAAAQRYLSAMAEVLGEHA